MFSAASPPVLVPVPVLVLVTTAAAAVGAAATTPVSDGLPDDNVAAFMPNIGLLLNFAAERGRERGGRMRRGSKKQK